MKSFATARGTGGSWALMVAIFASRSDKVGGVDELVDCNILPI